MTIGSENLGNGSAKPERLGNKYRGARRDTSTTTEESSLGTDLGSPESLPAGHLSDLGTGRASDLGTGRASDLGTGHAPNLGASHPSELGGILPAAIPPERVPTLPSLDMGGLTEPVFPPAGWPDVPSEPLVDHPLLRGLLMELPPKGSIPDSLWLDRWFEAARAILELLYVQDASRTR
ncbi:hypothetical protein ACN28C_05185 [Plantactinospora sp. WMMC1484]|uniref:hypothetical protein n=1 Tax=Plantactinospora sp. WMMC1484 TaxID=3404122 RepID=UPI003BF5CE83